MNKLLSLLVIFLATMHFVRASPTSPDSAKDEFMQGALTVYAMEVVPSIDASNDFMQYLEHRWNRSNCIEGCYQDGYKEAMQFVSAQGTKYAVQTNRVNYDPLR